MIQTIKIIILTALLIFFAPPEIQVEADEDFDFSLF